LLFFLTEFFQSKQQGGIMIIRLLALAALTIFTGVASGQSYPTKPIRLMTAGAGGGNDLISRIIASGISPSLGQQIVVENRGGYIMGDAFAKSPKDGYTLMLMGASVWLAPLLYDNVPFDPVRDFAAITITDKSPNIIAVHPSVPVSSLKELIALAKAKPGTLNWSSGNNGSPNHLAGELFKSMTGVDIVRIPYKSGAQETNDLLAGRVHMAFSPAGSLMIHVKAGKLKALAIASNQPSTLTPGVPTALEAGLPDFEAGSTKLVFAPTGTPVPIINRINQEIGRFLRLPETREKLLAHSVEPVGTTPEEASAFVKSEMTRMGKIIKDLGIRAE